ncbi:cytochrome c-type biogenesis protein [Saccharospirillum alexandrii]|uniref:cytochrome c-type biogenesis protein n=1 Tax=Saccharospirillum alexandrii TaxID=2448477 RepID=UPI000FD7299D|nr:cytochrome c-type biogenesis protein [Saccharospirillum alexandrii]
MRWSNRLIAAGLLFISLFAVAEQETLIFDNDTLRERYLDLTQQLRCPKCENQNIAGSNSPIAEDMRNKTYELLHLGYSDDQVVSYMIDRYTEFVIYQPRLNWGTVWLWLGPVMALLLGGLMVAWLARRSGAEPPDELSDDDRSRLQTLLDKDS